MHRAPRISQAQVVALPQPAQAWPAEWILGAVGLVLIVTALLLP